MGRIRLAILGLLVCGAFADLHGARASEPGDPRRTDAQQGSPHMAAPAELKTEKQKGSYALGYNVGQNLRKSFGSETLELGAFLLGLQESFSRGKASMTAAERTESLQAFLPKLQQRQPNGGGAVGDANKKKGDAFLTANKGKKGVKTLTSGLQYVVLKEGTGRQPKATDTVQVHYHGMLTDGTVFDSSVDRGEPATFRLDQVIRGWTEVVQLMKEGAKWRVFIPPDLAYGASGAGKSIGPNETLVFEIQLLKVE